MTDQNNNTAEQSATDLMEMKDFGIFYPTGHLVVGLPSEVAGISAQAALVAEGYSNADCILLDAKEVLLTEEENLRRHDGFLARLGWSFKAVEIHLELARKGGSLLVIQAKSDPEVERAMTIIRRAPFAFVHRYHALAIEELN
jgi:hypothetical protein